MIAKNLRLHGCVDSKNLRLHGCVLIRIGKQNFSRAPSMQAKLLHLVKQKLLYMKVPEPAKVGKSQCEFLNLAGTCKFAGEGMTFVSSVVVISSLGQAAADSMLWRVSCFLPRAAAGSHASSLETTTCTARCVRDDCTSEHEPSSSSQETTTSSWELRARAFL